MSAVPLDENEYARKHRKAVIEIAKAKIESEQISEIVRLEFSRLPFDDDFSGIRKVRPNIWLVAPEPGKKRTGNAKVERIKGEDNYLWTCNCKGWDKEKFVDCTHISRVRSMLGDGGAMPYDGRRRRPLTKWLFGKDEIAEDTRRNRARAAEPRKVPQLAFDMCQRFVKQPKREATISKGGGANGTPIPVRIFALLMKVFWNVDYEHLRVRLGENGLIWDLGFLKAQPPCKTSYSGWFGDPELTPILRRLFHETRMPVRRLDTMVLGDSHDMPTRVVENSRDRKFGPKGPKYRKERPLIRQHFLVAKVSGIVIEEETTVTRGIGSGDSGHLPSMLVEAKRVNEGINKAALDKAYSNRRNFGAAEALDVALYVREDGGEDRLQKDWPALAQRMTTLERNDPKTYRETYRFRSNAEGTPSRIKARNPCIRLRRRKKDPEPPPLPPGVTEETSISDLPEDVISAIMDIATARVGPARLNESLAILIVANLRRLNVLEHLLGQTMTFEYDVIFKPRLEMSESDLPQVA